MYDSDALCPPLEVPVCFEDDSGLKPKVLLKRLSAEKIVELSRPKLRPVKVVLKRLSEAEIEAWKPKNKNVCRKLRILLKKVSEDHIREWADPKKSADHECARES